MGIGTLAAGVKRGSSRQAGCREFSVADRPAAQIGINGLSLRIPHIYVQLFVGVDAYVQMGVVSPRATARNATLSRNWPPRDWTWDWTRPLYSDESSAQHEELFAARRSLVTEKRSFFEEGND